VQIVLTNNIIVQTDNTPYIRGSGGNITGSHNDCYGNGKCPAELSKDALNVDPKFAKAAGADFHPQAGSPVSGAGTPTVSSSDLDGIPHNRASALGAYEIPVP
jgi:hypothetical protein